MMRKAGLCFLVLLFSLQATAINAVMSHSVFYLDDPLKNGQKMPGVEIYWQINPRTLRFTTGDDKMITAKIKTDIIFISDTGIVKEDHFILKTVPSATVEELMTHSIIDLRRYFIGSGLFTIKVLLTDMADTMNKYAFSDSLNIVPPASAAWFSDVEILDTILPSDAHTHFFKNGRQQIPLCTNFLDDNKKVLHYYAELYGTGEISKTDYPLVQKVAISKKPDEAHYSNFIKTDTIKPGDVAIISGSFAVNTLPSGNYYLNVILESGSRKAITRQALFFQRLNLHPDEEDAAKAAAAKSDTGMEKVNVLNLDKTFLAKYSTAEVKAILKMLLPLSDPMGTQTINGFLKKPDDLYMRYYIYNYFLNINKKDPARAWKEYSERVIDVNKRFKGRGSKGYETDRGFIFLRYGAPTETITVTNETGALPYEIWQYNTLEQTNRKEITNAVFLFYKSSEMISDYKLLHSNVEGEAQNLGWRSFLYPNGRLQDNGNSRVDQYIGNK